MRAVYGIHYPATSCVRVLRSLRASTAATDGIIDDVAGCGCCSRQCGRRWLTSSAL